MTHLNWTANQDVSFNKTHLNRAAHEGVPLIGFHQDLPHVGRQIGSEVEHFRQAAREVLHRFTGGATFQGLIRSNQPEHMQVHHKSNYSAVEDHDEIKCLREKNRFTVSKTVPLLSIYNGWNGFPLKQFIVAHLTTSQRWLYKNSTDKAAPYEWCSDSLRHNRAYNFNTSLYFIGSIVDKIMLHRIDYRHRHYQCIMHSAPHLIIKIAIMTLHNDIGA